MPEDPIRKSSSFDGSRFQSIFASGVAILIGLFATFIPFIANPRFFFNDDEQNQYYPYYIDIGQHLRHHQWPEISLSTFYGGNFIIDWQYALFNPFSLLLYWIICPIQNLLLLGLVVFGIYLTIFALGGYWLGRVFGLNRIYSLTIAACLSMNNYIQYMYCDSWPSGLISLTWFTWAWVFLEQYRKNGHSSALLGITYFIYLTITSGWPHTILMLGLLMIGYMAELVFLQRLWPRALRLLLINIGVLLATTPYLLPALLSFSWMCRPSGIHSTGLLMPDLGSILNLSSPFFYPRIHLYGHEYAAYPMMYLAWFILPLLPLVSGQVAAETLRNHWGLIALAALSMVMLFGPENLGPIRYPIRFLPFLHMAILIAFFLAISSSGIFRISKSRLIGVLTILLFQFGTSVSVFPETLYLQVLGSIFDGIIVLFAVRLIYFRNIPTLGMLLLAVTMCFFCATHFTSRENGDLGDFHPPIQNNTELPTAAQLFSGYQLYLAPVLFDNTKDIRLGAQGIFDGNYTINGYCELGHAGLRPGPFGYNWFEMRDTSGIDLLLATEPTTQKSLVSLMRVNRMLIFNGYFDHVQPLLGKDWIQTSKGEYATVMERTVPNRVNTTLSFASDGIVAEPKGVVTGEREQLQITANPNGGQLVFARLYWPGFKGYLDGKPLAVTPLEKIFVKIDLPPGAVGELTLKFVPPGWGLALILAAIGSALWCATLFINFKERDSEPLPNASQTLREIA